MSNIEPCRQNDGARRYEIETRLETGTAILGNFVCSVHQVMAHKCGCFDPADFCQKCGNRKAASIDGKHCRLCDW